MTRDELIAEYKRLYDIGYELARLANYNQHWYPDSSLGMKIIEDGLEFFDDSIPNQYEEGNHTESRTVPWADIDNVEAATARYKAIIEDQKREQEKIAEEWGRQQFEKLKVKYES